MKQTAVEWLIEKIKNDQNKKAFLFKEWMEVIEQAKEMERKQLAANCIKLTNKDIRNEVHKLTEQWFFEEGIATDEGREFDAIEFKKRMSWNLGFWAGAEWCREQLKQKNKTNG